MNPSKIRLALVDDHRVLLDGLITMFTQDVAFEVMYSATSAEGLIRQFKPYEYPDILITDFTLPGLTGLELSIEMKRLSPETKVALLSMHDEVAFVRDALKAGIDGYILKNIDHAELKAAIKEIFSGNAYVSPEVARMLLNDLKENDEESSQLSDREKEVLRLITQELSNRQIAEKLFISERTVETHRKNIFRKTKTTNIVGLIKATIERKLI